MFILKGIGKFLLYSLIFIGMILAHMLFLVLFVWLAEFPLFAKLFSLYNSITQGSIDFLPWTLCFFRCFITNFFLQSVAFRLSGRVSLFVFSIAETALGVYAMTLTDSFDSFVITTIEIIFAVVLVVKCYKNNIDPNS